MAESAKRKTKTAKRAKNKWKTAEYVDHLLKLHKLQGELLRRLRKEIS